MCIDLKQRALGFGVQAMVRNEGFRVVTVYGLGSFISYMPELPKESKSPGEPRF